MRRIHRIVLLVGLVALSPVLSGCENFDMDKLDVFGLNEKKKLPGDRKPVFPEGVPGVTQGIPPEFIKGNQPPPDSAQTPGEQMPAAAPASKTAAVEPVEEPKPKPKPKRKPKPATASQPPPQITVHPGFQGQQQQAPWPAPAQQQPQQAPGPSTSNAPWPSSPAPGSFSR